MNTSLIALFCFGSALLWMINRWQKVELVIAHFEYSGWTPRRVRIIGGFTLQFYWMVMVLLVSTVELIWETGVIWYAGVFICLYIWTISLIPCSVSAFNRDHLLHIIRQVILFTAGALMLWLTYVLSH